MVTQQAMIRFMNDVVLIMQALANKDVYGIGGSDENALLTRGLQMQTAITPVTASQLRMLSLFRSAS